MSQLTEALSRVSYPGRGIVLGLHENGTQAVMLYFIMGRSENSRNRVFEAQGDGIRTKAHDESKMQDPSLIIYNPVRVLGNNTVVTNGDQTDTVYAELEKTGGTPSFYESVHAFDTALRTRQYEPDAPNFTPRISGIMHVENEKASYAMNILKAACCGGTDCCAAPESDALPCLRFTYEYENPVAGCGHFLHTYDGDGNPLPSFTGEPECVKLSGDIDAVTREAWDALDDDNKVSLFVRFLDLTAGSVESRIMNKFE